MKRRWIIRSFFIGLLLLWVGGWVGSYWYGGDIGYYESNKDWSVRYNDGQFELDRFDIGLFMPNAGWHARLVPAYSYIKFDFISSHKFLGLSIGDDPYMNVKFIAIPFYFPTAVCALLLLLVWRKTRPKVKGLAFPVEPSKPIEQGGKAK